jgi:hypothetical protein
MPEVAQVDYIASDGTARSMYLQNQDTHWVGTPFVSVSGPEIVVIDNINHTVSANDRIQIRATDGTNKALFIRSHYFPGAASPPTPPYAYATFWIADPNNESDGREDTEVYLMHPSDGSHYRIRIANWSGFPSPAGKPLFILD